MPVIDHNGGKCSHLCFYDWPLFCLAWLCLIPVEQVILINKKPEKGRKCQHEAGYGVIENRSVNVSRKSPVIQKGTQVALQAAEASWNNCTGVLALQKDFHFSNCKSNQIKSNLHFYSTFHTRLPRHFTQKAKPLKCL